MALEKINCKDDRGGNNSDNSGDGAVEDVIGGKWELVRVW